MFLQGPPGRHAKSFGFYNQKGAPHPKELFEERDDSKQGIDLLAAQKRLVDQTPASVSSFIKEQTTPTYVPADHTIGHGTPGPNSNRRAGQGIKLEAIDHAMSRQKIDHLMTRIERDSGVGGERTPPGKRFEPPKELLSKGQLLHSPNQIDV